MSERGAARSRQAGSPNMTHRRHGGGWEARETGMSMHRRSSAAVTLRRRGEGGCSPNCCQTFSKAVARPVPGLSLLTAGLGCSCFAGGAGKLCWACVLCHCSCRSARSFPLAPTMESEEMQLLARGGDEGSGQAALCSPGWVKGAGVAPLGSSAVPDFGPFAYSE